MYVTELRICYLVVHTDVSTEVLVVSYDAELMEKLIPMATSFWKRCLLPELICKFYTTVQMPNPPPVIPPVNEDPPSSVTSAPSVPRSGSRSSKGKESRLPHRNTAGNRSAVDEPSPTLTSSDPSPKFFPCYCQTVKPDAPVVTCSRAECSRKFFHVECVGKRTTIKWKCDACSKITRRENAKMLRETKKTNSTVQTRVPLRALNK